MQLFTGFNYLPIQDGNVNFKLNLLEGQKCPLVWGIEWGHIGYRDRQTLISELARGHTEAISRVLPVNFVFFSW